MEIKKETIRTTKITLSENEIIEALRIYLKQKEVLDSDQHLTFDFINTKTDEGTLLNIVIKNFNKDNNIHD